MVTVKKMQRDVSPDATSVTIAAHRLHTGKTYSYTSATNV
jgi:hypothetical protein